MVDCLSPEGIYQPWRCGTIKATDQRLGCAWSDYPPPAPARLWSEGGRQAGAFVATRREGGHWARRDAGGPGDVIRNVPSDQGSYNCSADSTVQSSNVATRSSEQLNSSTPTVLQKVINHHSPSLSCQTSTWQQGPVGAVGGPLMNLDRVMFASVFFLDFHTSQGGQHL